MGLAQVFSAARKDRLDLSVGSRWGVLPRLRYLSAPVLVLLSYAIGPTPMDLQFWRTRGGDGLCRHAYRRIYYKRRALGLVCRRFAVVCLRRLCHHTLSVAAASAVRKLFHLVWHQPFILDIASTARSLGLSRQRSMNALVCLCRSSMVKVARPDFPKR